MILTFALLAVAAATEPVTPAMDAFFDEVKAKRGNVQSLRAPFEEETVVPDDVRKSRGKLLYIRPQRIIRHTEDPAATILMDNRRIYQYEPDITQLQVFDLQDDPELDVLFMGFDDDMRKLLEAYDVKLLNEDGMRGVQVTPKFNPHNDPLFEELRILFEEEHLLPKRIDLLSEDSRAIYTIGEYEVNPTLDPAESQIALPEGTVIIENDNVREEVGVGGKLVPAPLTPGAEAPVSTGDGAKQIEVRELEPLALPAPEAAPAESATP